MTDNKEFASFKRFLEYYSADSDFRNRIEENTVSPDEMRHLGITLSDYSAAVDAVKAILYRYNEAVCLRDNDYYKAYVCINRDTNNRVSKSVAKSEYCEHNQLYDFEELTFKRCGMERDVIRTHTNIHYFPLCFELSEGCRVQCDFCGFEAERFKSNFEYNEANKDLWIQILQKSKEIVGNVAKTAPFYFATEPFDNPDYTSFLMDAYSIFGDIPQTTTALADAYPQKIRQIIEFSKSISGTEYMNSAHLRFSIRSLKQLMKIYDLYTPDELEAVELLANNPESVNRYSDSGKVLSKDCISASKRNSYSICCVSGIKVNMVSKTMEFIEPEVPSPLYPKGYRVREKVEFTNASEYSNNLYMLYNKYAISKLPMDRALEINNNVNEVHVDNRIGFVGDKVNIAFNDTYVLSQAINMIKEEKTVTDILTSMGLFGESKESLIGQLDRMFNNGYLRIKQ